MYRGSCRGRKEYAVQVKRQDRDTRWGIRISKRDSIGVRQAAVSAHMLELMLRSKDLLSVGQTLEMRYLEVGVQRPSTGRVEWQAKGGI